MSSLTPEDLLAEGAVLAEPTVDTMPAVARGYANSLLPGRTVVTVLPERLVEAEDIANATLGFVGETLTEVGHVPSRAIGFPAWPIITDPGNAHHALAIVGDLTRVKRLAKNSKGAAKDTVDELATRLAGAAPHFLPTYFEEVGRIFLSVESPTFAAQYFGKAREAETTYGIPVDEDRHRRAFLDFALDGALSAKALAAEARRLSAAFEPADAYERYVDVVLRRVRGGLPPHTDLPKDVKRLAKAAGHKPADALAEVAAALLPLPSLRGASSGLWKGLLPGVIDAVKADPELRVHLIAYIPDSVDFEAWTDVLDSTGTLDRLRTHASPEELAGWTERAIAWVGTTGGWRAKDENHTLAALLETLPLNQIERAVDVGLGWHSARLDVVDVVLAAGVEPILGSAREAGLEEQTVWSWIGSPATRDLGYVAAHDVLGPFVAARTADCQQRGRSALTPEQAQRISTSPGVLELLNRALDIDLPIGIIKRANINRAADLRGRYAPLAHPDVADAVRLAERTAHLTAADVLLAAHLNIGVGAELTWSAWEELDDSVHRKDVREYYSNDGPDIASWPYVGLVDDREIIVVGPDGEVLRHTPVLPGVSTRSVSNALVDLQESGGRWVLAFRDDQWKSRVYWVDDPAHIVEPPGGGYYYSAGAATMPLAGRRIFGPGAVLAPDAAPAIFGTKNLLVDESRCWVTDDDKFTEIDPITGARVGSSRPGWIDAVAGQLPQRFRLLAASAHQRPGHLGVVTAVAQDIDRFVWRLLRSDGAHLEWETPRMRPYSLRHQAPLALVDVPGGRWRATAHGVYDVETGCQIPVRPQFDADDHRGRTLPLSFWDLLKVRSETASLRLRSVTPADLTALTDAARAGLVGRSRASDVKGDMITRHEEAALDAAIGGTSGRLRTTVLGAARWAVLEASRWTALFAESADGSRQRWRASESDAAVTCVLRPTYYNADPSGDVRGFVNSVEKVRAALAGESDDTPASNEFEILAAHVETPGVLAALAAVTDDDAGRARIVEVADRLLAAGLADGRAWVRELDSNSRSTRENIVAATDSGTAVTADMGWMDPPLAIGVGDPRVVDADAGAPVRVPSGPLGDDLRAVLAAIGHHGKIPRRDDAIAEFASATGLSEIAATLLLATPLGADLSGSDASEVREALGYKATEVKQAREDLQRYTRATRFAALALSVPFPVSAWWGDDESSRHARRSALAAASARLTAERPPMLLSPEERARARKELGHGAEAAELLATPSALQNIDPDKRFAAPDGSHYSLTQLWTALLWFGATLPAEHRVRAALPELARFVAERVRDPQACTTVLRVYQSDDTIKAIESILGLPSIDLNVPRVFEVGPFEAIVDEYKCIEVHVRVGALKPDDAPTLEAVLGSHEENYYANSVRPLLAAARGELEQVIAAFDPAGPPGELCDPRFSAPQVVSAVSAELGLDEDAATYYLQLLALPRPTDADIKRFNEWKPAAFTKVRAALLDAGLVSEAKRARAMRSVFLPGAWVDLKYDKGFPIEAWKLPFLGIADYGDRRAAISGAYPLPIAGYARLYEWAWERFTNGDRPEFITLDAAMEARRKR